MVAIGVQLVRHLLKAGTNFDSFAFLLLWNTLLIKCGHVKDSEHESMRTSISFQPAKNVKLDCGSWGGVGFDPQAICVFGGFPNLKGKNVIRPHMKDTSFGLPYPFGNALDTDTPMIRLRNVSLELETRAQYLVYIHNNLRLLSRNPNDDVKIWDVGGDAFDSMEDVGFLEFADLSLDEPEFENDLIIDN
ncbi:hypothetical protein Tco_0549066 [Tanacetum coccineum]